MKQYKRCSLTRSTKQQGTILTWNLLRCVKVVPIDVLEVLTSEWIRYKGAIMGYLFTHYISACPIEDEKVVTLSKLLQGKWIVRLKPTENLFSGRDKTFTGNLTRICAVLWAPRR